MASPTIGFVGPMLGRNEGWVTTQGELLADRFAAEGYTVLETSTRPGRIGRLVDTVRCLLRWRDQLDVVVLSVFSGPAFVMADVSSSVTSRLGVPTVMVLHGGNLPVHRDRFPRWTRRVLARADATVAPSSFLAAAFADHEVGIIPNLVDTELIPHRRRTTLRPRLLWMRTFHPVYHPELAVEALALVRRRHPDVRLTMAGQEKGSIEAVHAAVRARGVEDAVEVVGFLDEDGKRRAFEDHDLYLHTNRIDNTPVSLLEAAAAGLPIVGTAVGGVPDLVQDGEDALLVPSEDAAAMADAVDRVLTDPALAARLSDNGRRLAERSTWPVVRERWLEVFDRLTAAEPRFDLPPLPADPTVTVVMPVRNEAAFLDRSLGAVLTQVGVARPQVIVVDGDSDDGTTDRVRTLADRHGATVDVLVNDRRIVPVSMNLGLAHATGDVIVRVDGHCVIAPDYLHRCLEALRATGDACAGGPMATIGETGEAASIAVAQSSRVGVGGVAFRTSEEAAHVDTLAFGAYRREVFDRIGGFDEDLIRNQDDELNLRLTRAGGRIWMDPSIRSTYFSRGSLAGLWRQYHGYGFYKVRVMRKHRTVPSPRHLVPAAFVGGVAVGAAASVARRSPWPLTAVLGPYAAAVAAGTISAARSSRDEVRSLTVAAAIVTMHAAYGSGWWAGIGRAGQAAVRAAVGSRARGAGRTRPG